ncbi:MAG: sigma-70 family RNA polymerase sigma factor [Anaerolineae bacterium]
MTDLRTDASGVRNTTPGAGVVETRAEVDADGLDEERLLASRASGGDREAYGVLYDRYLDKIYRYIYFKVGRRSEAEDLTSQTFLKAWDAIGDYEWRNHPFGAWLFRIAHNLVVDYHRSRKPSVELDNATPQLEWEASRDDVRPEGVLAEMLTTDRVRHAIGRLTEEQQQVLVLRFFEDLSTGEVAEIMGKRRGAVRGLQFRALSALREMLYREQDELT